MDTSKLLTIIIPTYNMEGLLGRCLDSLIVPEDEAKELEVLVIIDGATDHSSEIAHEYEARFPEVFCVIDKPNGNYGSCINRGLAEARGKYIKVLDADDTFNTTALRQLINHLLNIDTDLVLTNYCICDNDGRCTEHKTFEAPTQSMLCTRDLGKLGPHMAMHAVTYKTENLRNIGYTQTEGISYTDQEWIYRPMTTIKSFTYLNIDLYNYTVGRSGQTMDLSSLSRNMHHNLTVMRSMISTYNATPDNSDIYEYLRRRIEGYAEYVYSLYLFNMKVMDVKPLIDFDRELKSSCPTLYRFIGKLRAGKLPHVRLWRLFYYTDDHGINDFFRYRKYRFL